MPEMSLGDLILAFSLSVSAFYPPFTFPETIDPLPDYSPRPALSADSESSDPRYTPTSSRMALGELQDAVSASVLDTHGSQYLYRVLNPEIYRNNVKKALLDRRCASGEELEEVWPSLRTHVIWCDMSVGDCIWASVLLHFRHAAASKEWRRPMELHQLTGANHFVSTTVANRFRSRVADGIRLKVHWEEPERFVQLLIDII